MLLHMADVATGEAQPETLQRLGFYALAGAPRSPRDLIGEVHDAERLGLGWAFISERFNIKEAATISGAVGAVSSRIQIATAATNHNTRHPIVTAAYATTMHRLTDGRFTLGLGRGIAPLVRAFGLPAVTTAQLEDFAGLMRRLWRGETVIGHDGPAGRYPFLRLDPTFDEDIPLGITAFGPQTLALGGRWGGQSGAARCPAHDDRKASLSLSRGEGGRPLWRCHAGCTQEAVLEALRERGLNFSSLT